MSANISALKQCSIPLDSHLLCCESWFIYVICIIYVYWCPTLFPYQMMFVSFKSNAIDVTCGTWTANPFGAPQYTRIFSGIHISRSFVFCVCFVGRCLSFSFLFWPLCCFSFFDSRLLIIFMVSYYLYGILLSLWYLQTLLMKTGLSRRKLYGVGMDMHRKRKEP